MVSRQPRVTPLLELSPLSRQCRSKLDSPWKFQLGHPFSRIPFRTAHAREEGL